MNEQANEVAKSTGYDARLQFLEVLGSIMRAKAVAVANNDSYMQERLLRQMLYMMRPFIKPSQYDELIQSLNIAKKFLAKKDPRFSYYIEKNLDAADSMIYERTAHVLLPVKTDDMQEDIDWEKFMRESDL